VSTDRRPIVSPVRLGELAGLAASARPSLGAVDLRGSTDDRDAAVVSAAPDFLDPPDPPDPLDLPDARPARSAED